MSWDNNAGRFVSLRLITPRDYDVLFRLHTEPRNLVLGRLAGTTPNPDEFGRFLWNGVLTQYIIEQKDKRVFAGLVTAYNADYRNGHVYLAIMTPIALDNMGWPLEAALLLVEMLFRRFPFRKIYFDALEFNYARFRSGQDRLFHLEGVRREHYYFDGKYWDAYTLAIYREDAATELPKILGSVRHAFPNTQSPPEAKSGPDRIPFRLPTNEETSASSNNT